MSVKVDKSGNPNEIMRISQSVISSPDLKFSKRVNAFTEQGVAMLSGVLHSPRAVEVNVAIMRAFVRLREFLASQAKLGKKLAEIGNRSRPCENTNLKIQYPTLKSKEQGARECRMVVLWTAHSHLSPHLDIGHSLLDIQLVAAPCTKSVQPVFPAKNTESERSSPCLCDFHENLHKTVIHGFDI